MRTAVVLSVGLPRPLETFRRRHVPTANLGVPAHVTLLYPFVPAEQLRAEHLTRLGRAVERAPAFVFRLDRIERWPDTVYVAVEPTAPFHDLQRELARRWPEWPLYEGAHAFEPHVTIAEQADDGLEAEARRLAARVLPVARVGYRIRIIVEDERGTWNHLTWIGLPR